MAKKSGLKVDRKYTTPGNPYNNITWEKRSSKITNPDGSVVFEMNDVEIPSTWSQVATDIMVSKYFRSGDISEVILTCKKHFKKVTSFKPKSSRKESSEIYLVCLEKKSPID